MAQDSGDCDDYVIKYSYDAAAQHCKAYYYGGCGGNGNRFDSELECESACTGRRPPSVDSRGKYR